MTELVSIKKEMVVADSREVAVKFNKQHKNVLTKIYQIEKELKDVSRRSSIFMLRSREYQGRKFPYFLMNKAAFSLLVMSFTGSQARVWAETYISSFELMEETLANLLKNKIDKNWITARNQGKQIRNNETEVIKEFIAYAEGQGSTHAKFYYKHFTNVAYKCLSLVQNEVPSLRDTLGLFKISHLSMAEILTAQLLRKYMKQGIHYKEIYFLVKQELIKFGETPLRDITTDYLK